MDSTAPLEGVAHGKLLLFGEHAAVYGHPAVGLTLKSSLTVRLVPAAGERWSIPAASPQLESMLIEFLAHAEGILPELRDHRGRIEVTSDIPQGMGFGSSAAWCVALVRAVLGGATPPEAVWEAAHQAEGFFHGTPSGIDTGLALLDGLYAFTTPHPSTPRTTAAAPAQLPKARRLPGVPLELIVGAVPRDGSTRGLVGSVRTRMEAGDPETQATVERLGRLSAEAISLLTEAPEGALPALAARTAEAQLALRNLGLSTPSLEELIERGQELGALAGKLSGAGGGGAFYLIFDRAERADRALPILQSLAAERLTGEPVSLFRLSWTPSV